MVDEEEFRKKIMELATKAALASIPEFNSQDLFNHPLEGMIAMSMAERSKDRMKQLQNESIAPQTNTTMGGFFPTNNVRFEERPKTQIENFALNNKSAEDPYDLKATKTHLENPITKLTDKIKQGFETPKPRELSQIPMEIKDPNQWHIDSAPLPEIKNKLRTFAEKMLDKSDKYKDLTVMEAVQKAASKLPIPNTEAGYYGISAKISDGEEMSKKAKEQNTFYKLKDIKDPEIAKNLREKMAKSKGLDVNNPKDYQTLQNSSVVVPKVDSDLYKYAKNSEKTKQWVADNYDKLENKTIENKDKHITYPASVAFPSKRALNLTIQNADLTTSKVNKDKSMNVRLDDIYDFSEMKKQHTNTHNPINMGKQAWHNVISDINNRAYSQQEKGQLEPYGLSMPIYYTPEEIEEMKKKYRKKRH